MLKRIIRQKTVYIVTEYIDMRKGIDGLDALIERATFRFFRRALNIVDSTIIMLVAYCFLAKLAHFSF